jgi:thiol-disulfide isomerase/thioredoxin
MLLSLRVVSTISLSVAVTLGVAQTTTPQNTSVAADKPVPAYRSDPKFVDALKEAKLLQRQKKANFAADAYKKANKIAGGQCEECLQGLFQMQIWDGSNKDAIATANMLIAQAANPLDKSLCQSELAQAMMAQAGNKPKPAQLEAIHAEFQQAIASYPKNASAYFLDGKVLAQMGKMDEASADFKQCLTCSSPKDPAHLRAQHFAENPELSLHKMAPAFEVTALDGSRFNLDAMGGRVVLIDFWATWCGPCNEELPHMKKIAKEFAGQPLVIISVSWDSDEAKWKDFIQKNGMTWIQYRDADHSLSNLFGINAIPHYFTIDADGVLTAEMLGEGSDVEGKLKKLITKAREAQVAQQTPATLPADAVVSSTATASVSPVAQIPVSQ